MRLKILACLLVGIVVSGCELLKSDKSDKVDEKISPPMNQNGVDAFEPNNSASVATLVKITDIVSAKIQSEKDEDFYTFVIPDSLRYDGILRVKLTQFSKRPDLKFYDSLKAAYGPEHLYSMTKGADLAGWMSVKPGSKYYVSVSYFSKDSSATSYKLAFEYMPVIDEKEPDNRFSEATPMILDTLYKSYLFASQTTDNDNYTDYFSFTLIDSAKVIIALTNFPIDVSPDLKITSELTGSSIEHGYSFTKGASLLLPTKVLPPGRYFVLVSPLSASLTNGREGLELPDYVKTQYHLKVSKAL